MGFTLLGKIDDDALWNIILSVGGLKMKKSRRQNKNRKNLVQKRLVLVEHIGDDCPYTEDLEESGDLYLLAADSSFSLFEATKRGYEELRKRAKETPYVLITTKVEDGRYVSQGGDTVYVLGGRVVDEREFIRQWLGKDCWFYELDDDEQDAIPSF